MLKLGVAELAKSVGGLGESTGIYLLKSPKSYVASATQEPQLLPQYPEQSGSIVEQIQIICELLVVAYVVHVQYN